MLDPRRAKVPEQLCDVFINYGAACFHFNNQSVCYKQVHAKTA